jgi:hypothetical protein
VPRKGTKRAWIGKASGFAYRLFRPDAVRYYLCWSPVPVPLAKLISVAVARWRIEEDTRVRAATAAGFHL